MKNPNPELYVSDMFFQHHTWKWKQPRNNDKTPNYAEQKMNSFRPEVHFTKSRHSDY